MSSCLHPLQAQRRWLLHTPGSTLPKAGCKGQAPERKMMVPGPSLLGRLCVDKPPPPGRGGSPDLLGAVKRTRNFNSNEGGKAC